MSQRSGAAEDRAEYARYIQGLLRSGAEPFYQNSARADMRRHHINAPDVKNGLRICSVTSLTWRASGDMELVCMGETRQGDEIEVQLRICEAEGIPVIRVTAVNPLTDQKEEI
jgi:hypothetical protein